MKTKTKAPETPVVASTTRQPLPPFPSDVPVAEMTCGQCLAYLAALKAAGWVWHLDDDPADVFPLEELSLIQAEKLDAFVNRLDALCHTLVPLDEAHCINAGAWTAAELVNFYDKEQDGSEIIDLWTDDYNADHDPEFEREHGAPSHLEKLRFGDHELGLTLDQQEEMERDLGYALDSDTFDTLDQFLAAVGWLVDNAELWHHTRFGPDGPAIVPTAKPKPVVLPVEGVPPVEPAVKELADALKTALGYIDGEGWTNDDGSDRRWIVETCKATLAKHGQAEDKPASEPKVATLAKPACQYAPDHFPICAAGFPQTPLQPMSTSNGNRSQ